MHVIDWFNQNTGFATTASTSALLLVTFWYARTTKSMAASAKASAEDSKLAALAAKDAVSVAQAQVRVDFDGYFFGADFGADLGEGLVGIGIRSTGDSVIVQRVGVLHAFRDRKSESNRSNRDDRLSGQWLDSSGWLPRRVHNGEMFAVTHDIFTEDMELPREQYRAIRKLELQVDYTFSETSELGGSFRFDLRRPAGPFKDEIDRRSAKVRYFENLDDRDS